MCVSFCSSESGELNGAHLIHIFCEILLKGLKRRLRGVEEIQSTL